MTRSTFNGHRTGHGHVHGHLQRSIAGYWREIADMAEATRPELLAEAAGMLLDAQSRGRLIFITGNGGSAATASHFACDLAKGTRNGGPPTFRVVALTDNVPLLTAWGNDAEFADVFAQQLVSLARPGDVLVAISTSGTSPNIVAAADAARDCGVRVLALTGRRGGGLADLSDLAIRIPSDRIEVVEDAHMTIAHSLCVALRAAVAGREDAVVRSLPMAEGQAIEASA